MFAHTEELGIPDGVKIVEIYNGGSRDNEDQIAIDNAAELGYLGIAGSDSHIVSHIGRCGTEFSADIRSMDDLVGAAPIPPATGQTTDHLPRARAGQPRSKAPPAPAPFGPRLYNADTQARK